MSNKTKVNSCASYSPQKKTVRQSFEIDFVIKTNAMNEGPFHRTTVIFELDRRKKIHAFNFTAALSCVYNSSMINHKFISFSAVQIYDLSYIHLHYVVTTAKICMWKQKAIKVKKALINAHGLRS